MAMKTAHDFDQELLILFDAYVHGGINRRTFLDKATKFAGGGVTAAMLLEQRWADIEDKACEVFPRLDQAKTKGALSVSWHSAWIP